MEESSLQNSHVKVYIVLGTLAIIAVGVVVSIWSIYGVNEGSDDHDQSLSQELQDAASEQQRKQQELERQVNEFDRIRTAAGTELSTPSRTQQVRGLNALHRKNASSESQKPLATQISEMDALRAAMEGKK